MGGPAKSQLVHEVDALGGEMGKMADRTYVQKRVLNMSKVHPRVACRSCALHTLRPQLLAGQHRQALQAAADPDTHRLAVQGPAVWALRAQTDKLEYARLMRGVLEATPNLALREGMAVDVELGPNDEVWGALRRALPARSLRCKGAQPLGPFSRTRACSSEAGLCSAPDVLCCGEQCAAAAPGCRQATRCLACRSRASRRSSA